MLFLINSQSFENLLELYINLKYLNNEKAILCSRNNYLTNLYSDSNTNSLVIYWINYPELIEQFPK